jgi:elongation factor P
LRAKSSGRRSAWRDGVHQGRSGAGTGGAFGWKSGGRCARRGAKRAVQIRRATANRKECSVKVIASSLRKGNVVEMDGRLYVVLTAQNFHPGKGTPVTQVDMRRISDGVKVSERWRTTEQVERATVDEREYDYLYEDGEGFHFMEPVTYEQIAVSPDVVGDGKVYLQEGMRVYLKTFEGVAIAIEYPQKITVEITGTEPVVKGQTASSSYKPAMTDNGLRVMVPPHIGPGTRIVINTEDNSYVERAKD